MDGGASWVTASSGLPPGFQVNALAVDPGNSQTLYASVNEFGGRTYQSTDGGATWLRIGQTMFPNSPSDLVVDPSNGQRLYTAAGSSGVYRSLDGGATWSPAAQAWPQSLVVSRLTLGASGVLFAATEDGVYRLDTAPNGVPVAADGSTAGLEDIPQPLLLAASDPDSQPLTYTVTSQPLHGTLTS